MESLEDVEKALAEGVVKPFSRVRLEAVLKVKRGGRPSVVAHEMGCATRNLMAMVSRFDAQGPDALVTAEESPEEREAAEAGVPAPVPEMSDEIRSALVERLKEAGALGSLKWFRSYLREAGVRVRWQVSSAWYSTVRAEVLGAEKRGRKKKEPREPKKRGARIKWAPGQTVPYFGRDEAGARPWKDIAAAVVDELGIPKSTFHRITRQLLAEGVVVKLADGRLYRKAAPRPLEVVEL